MLSPNVHVPVDDDAVRFSVYGTLHIFRRRGSGE